MKPILLFLALCIIAVATPEAFAADYYSDPVNGSMGNDGSESSPWDSMKAIFEAQTTFEAGDVLYLMDGAHGQSYISEAHTNYVTIRPCPGHSPKVSTVLLDNGAAYWAFDNIIFTVDGTGGSTTRNYMLSMTDKASYIKIENCIFYSAESSAAWSKADWNTYAIDAVYLDGDHIIFNTNTIKNVYHALRIEGDHAEVKNNLIDNFGADAIRALSSHAVYENNVIRDAYIEDYNVNHDDAIQLYDADNVAGGLVEDILLRNNIIYSFADPITQAMIDDDLVGYSMQGIIITDGHGEDIVVENNLIVSDHYHGITLAGAINCRIQNNTVIKTPTSVNPTAGALPWIQLKEDKQGNNAMNCIIRNNIASDFTPWTYAAGVNILAENNLEPAPVDYTNVFSDYSNFDFKLQTSSAAIDAGVNTDLTATDLDHQPRLAGPFVDLGAYEAQSSGDLTPPSISAVADTYYNDEVVVMFSESVVQASAEDSGNYSISGGVNITQASLNANGSTVTLATSPLTGGTPYTITANGVEDYAGNPSSGTTGGFNYLCNTSWASSYQDDQWGTNPPEDAFDANLSTRWSAEGDGEWIQYGFCQAVTLESVDMAFFLGNERTYSMIIEVSPDGRSYTQVFSGSSAGGTTALENFDFTDTPAKYVRITGSGNNVNEWNNYTEIVLHTTAISLSGYEAWILDFTGIGTATNLTDNPDNDALNNLYEWALGGNPGNSNDVGHVPTVTIIEYLGDAWLEYTYAKRNDADALGLVYYVEQNTNLVDGVWINANYDFQAGLPDSAGAGFGTVTNWVNTDLEDAQFLRLIIEAH